MKWETVKLSECCSSIADGDHQPPPKAISGVPFVTISNINTSLYSVVGSFGIPVLIKEYNPFVFQRHIAILRPNEKVLPAFLYYTMLSKDFYAKADAVALGAAQRTVSLTSLRNIRIELPPVETQNRIVSILSAYDDLIENNQKQIKLLEEAACIRSGLLTCVSPVMSILLLLTVCRRGGENACWEILIVLLNLECVQREELMLHLLRVYQVSVRKM